MSCAALNPIFRAIFANSRFVHCSLAHSLLPYLIPHNKDQNIRYNNSQALSFQPLTLFILACEHNNQTNGKPSKTAFFLIHSAIFYTAAEERRLSLYCLKPLLLRNYVPMLFWYFKVTRQLLELALTCIVLGYLRMRLKNHCISFSL